MNVGLTNLRRPARAFHGGAVRTGLFTGLLLALVFLGWVITANRMPKFEPISLARNIVCLGAFGVFMTIPIGRYLKSPWRLFTAGFIAWLTFVAAYSCAALYFENLVNRFGKTPFHMMVLGVVIYAVTAVMVWVVSSFIALIPHAVHEPQPQTVKITPRIR